MDWILPGVLFLTILVESNKVQCVRINTFNSFVGANYEPAADFSLGAYAPNMPVASIYPMMTEESFHTVVGLPTMKQPAIPFLNPFVSAGPQNPVQTNKRKNPRNNGQRTLNYQQQGSNGPPKNRGVTLDVRGGGYKVEKPQNPKPYKAPNAESSNRNTQRHNNGRNGLPWNNGRPHNSPSRNRKPNQAPRGPTMKNPHYNIKFETSLPSMPANVEFVNPENVLPLHPRIYKTFLQQNKQFASYFPHINKPNKFKSQNSENHSGSFHRNNYNHARPSSSKQTRSRGNPPNSSFKQAAQFSNFAPNFQSSGGEMSSSSTASQNGFFQQQNGGKPFNFDTDFFNQDPSFYSSLAQTPEGQAILSYIQQQGGESNKPSIPKSQRPQNKPQQQTAHLNSPTYTSSTFPGGTGLQAETGVPPITTNYFGASQGIGQNVAGSVNHNQSPSSDYQQMLMYYHQQMQQLTPQHSPPSVQTSYQGQASGPIYPPNQQYANPQVQSNPFGEYQYTQGQSSHFQDQSQTLGSAPESTTYSKSKAHPNEKGNHPQFYQHSHQDIKSQMPEFHTADHSEYTLPPFSVMDPLTTVENNNQEIHDYYGYHHTSTQQKSPLYPGDQSLPSYSQGALHEISPYTGEKASIDHSTSSPNNDHKSASSPNGYLTPEQLFAPQSTGLQSEAKFGYPSAHGGLSSAASSINKDSAENEAAGSAPNEQIEGGERAALHEYTVNYDPFSYRGSENLKEQNDFWKKEEMKDNSEQSESESDEKLHETMHEFQKLLTKAPKTSYIATPSDTTYPTLNLTTTRASVLKKDPSSEESMKNHKTTPSYMFQYAPAEKTATKVPPTWHAWKPNASRYHLPLPETKLQVTTPIPSTTSTTPMTTTPQTTTIPTTTSSPETSTKLSLYHEPEKPACARSSGKNYCLQDTEYPKEKIKDAIEKNRHPLDHFLVDISASSNVVEDTDYSKVFENSVPLQSTSISYSFEGKAISPVQPNNNTAGCSSNVYYVKPLRAINTAGMWRIIVNVEFEETGANYTQTVRMEECSHTPGYVASCGHETISACLQKYKLQRLLSWEEHRGFYIDAFLLPHECFCGSQHESTR